MAHYEELKKQKQRAKRSAAHPTGTPSSRSVSSLAQSPESSVASYKEPKYVGASCDERKPRNKGKVLGHAASISTMHEVFTFPTQYKQKTKGKSNAERFRMKPAGIDMNRFTELTDFSANVDNIKSKPKNENDIRANKTDPIKHSVPEVCARKKFAAKVGDTAGQPSARLTALTNTLTGDVAGRAPKPGFRPPSRTNIVKHSTETLCKSQVNLGGLKRFDHKFDSQVPLEHRDRKPFTPQTDQQIAAKGGIMKQKESRMPGGGAVVYMPAGEGDTLPTATKRFIRSDIKFSRCPEAFGVQSCPDLPRQHATAARSA